MTQTLIDASIPELQDTAYRQAAAKGFHDYAPEDPRARLAHRAEALALIHTEVSEALEELREGHPVDRNYYTLPGVPAEYPSISAAKATQHGPDVVPKPEGVPSELADIVIRVMDFCGANGIDLEAAIVEKLLYNQSRPHMHGGKLS